MKLRIALLLLAPCLVDARETTYSPPHVSFITIHTAFSKLPSVYIDEWGNARIDAFCHKEQYIDLKLGAARFEEAAQLLRNLDFHALPYSPDYQYKGPKDKRVWTKRECDHCDRFVVSFNERGFGSLHTVEFVEFEKDRRIETIKKVIGVITRGEETRLCKE